MDNSIKNITWKQCQNTSTENLSKLKIFNREADIHNMLVYLIERK